VKAVNLLPERHRPRRSSGGRQGSSYVVLGVLGALLLALVVYVLTLNSINSGRDQIAVAKAETEQAQSQTRSLSAYGDFAKVKEKRVAAVTQLAKGRFDWERLVRELAHVLPENVWLVKTDASALGDLTAADTGAGGASGGASTPGAPVVKLSGCARDQSQVAVTLVRLRELQGADDVQLDHSAKPEDASATAASSTSGSVSPGAADGCGTTHGHANYAFDAVVTFEPQATTATDKTSEKAPASLGGGA
jgi:Tfp pilus assembly protein PilN